MLARCADCSAAAILALLASSCAGMRQAALMLRIISTVSARLPLKI